MPKTYRALITIQDEVGGGGGRPIDPGFGQGGGEHPEHGLPGHGLHPDQGLPGSGGGSAGQLPVWPDDAPPGTVWPPLPPEFEGDGKKAIVLAAIEGVGYRYIVVQLGEGEEGEEGPDQGLPDEGEGEGEDGEEKPDQGLPPQGGRPPQPGQGLPPQRPGQPPQPGQGLPPQRPGQPPQPGQGLPGGQPSRPGQPPTAQPKPVGRR